MTSVSSNHSDKLGLWGALPYGRNWLTRTGQTGLLGRSDRNRWDEGGAGGLMVEGNRLGEPPLDIEVRRAAGSDS